MAKHKVITTGQQIDRAIAQAKSLDDEPRVIAVDYRPGSGLDLFILRMSSGERHIIPREMLEGLQHATRAQLAGVQILGHGTGLHWPALDVDHYVPALLRHVYGTSRWMAQIGRQGGAARTEAKAKAARANGLKGGRPKRTPVRQTA
jgi:hypothetical protein